MVAEIAAREVGRLDLSEALELTALIAERDRLRSDRYRVRWLQRCIQERALSIAEVVLIGAALSALGGPCQAQALAFLRGTGRDVRLRDR